MKRLNLAFVGFGNAAQAFAKLVVEKKAAFESMGFEIRATVVITATKGNCYSPEGLTFEALLDSLERHGRFVGDAFGLTSVTGMELIQLADYDVLIEVSPLNIQSGQPAIDHIKSAIKRGKHVITANKGPIAWAYDELKTLAMQMGCGFYFETTVMDGAPVFNLFRETLPLCTVTKIKGILNTTTNFVLESMEQGLSYEEAMDEGRRRGFVEADPSMDIDGFDAAAKLCALMNVMMDAKMTPDRIKRTGISGITAEDIQKAQTEGKKIKLLCHAERKADGFRARVAPEQIPLTDPYAGLNGTSSVYTITTDLMGPLTLFEHDPEIEQTGYGLLSDLVALIRREMSHN